MLRVMDSYEYHLNLLPSLSSHLSSSDCSSSPASSWGVCVVDFLETEDSYIDVGTIIVKMKK